MTSAGKIFLIVTCFIIACSCKKEIDTYLDFQIIQPVENSQWNAGDTIPFEIKLNNQVHIKQARICIVNRNAQPLSTELLIDNRDNKWNYKGKYPISPQIVSSDFYFFRVTLMDQDNNLTTRMVRIHVFVSPPELKSIFVLLRKGNNQYELQRSDSLPLFYTVLQITSDYSNALFNSQHEKFIFCGKQTGPLTIYDINNFQILWQEQPLLNPPFDYFENIDYDGEHLIVGYTDSRIKGYTLTGIQKFAFQVPQIQPYLFFRHTYQPTMFDLFFICGRYIGQIHHYFGVFSYYSFIQQQYHSILWKPLRIFAKSNAELVIIGNNGNNGVIYEFNIPQNVFTHRVTMPAGKFYDAIQMAPHTYAISHDNGIYIYNAVNFSINTFTSMPGGGVFVYEANHKHMYYAINQILYRISYPDGENTLITTFTHPIIKIFLYYQ